MKKFLFWISPLLFIVIIVESTLLFFLQQNNTLQFISVMKTTMSAFTQKNSSIALFTSMINAKNNPLCDVATTKLVYSGVIREIEVFSKQHALRISLTHQQSKFEKRIALTVDTDNLIVIKSKKRINTNELVTGDKIKVTYEYDQKKGSQLNTVEILQ